MCQKFSMKQGDKLILRLFSFFKPYKKDTFIALTALFITAVAILLFGRVAKYFIDFGLSENSDGFFLFFLGLVFILAISGYLRSKLINSVCFKIATDIRVAIYKNIIQISPQFFENVKSGDVNSRITNDVNLVFEILSGNFAFFLRNSILFVGSLILLFVTSSKLTIISILLIFLAILPIFIFAKKIKNLSKKSQEFSADLNSEIEENIGAIKTIQAYLAQNKVIDNFCKINEEFLATNLKKAKLKSLLVAVSIFFAFLSIAIILKIGASFVLSQKISSGDLSSFIFYAVISSISAVGLGQIFSQMQTLKSALQRIFFLIDAKSVVTESTNSVAFQEGGEIKIVFKNVNFSYPSKKEIVIFKDFNLEINQGEKIAICGESGIGKSTVLNLLLRFYDVCGGEILINNIDIKNLSFESLRNIFSYVSQDNFIFSGTVFENISYGNKNVDRKKIEEIIDFSEALSFIKEMPEGLETKVGERGSKLSGGQKQRIAILRALVKDSRVLLLDEATSALDSKNEELILKLINNFSKDKTVILIAHKLPKIIDSYKLVDIK